jgi:hypothetical protein
MAFASGGASQLLGTLGAQNPAEALEEGFSLAGTNASSVRSG